MLQLADLGSVPVAFIFPSAFMAPFEGGPTNKLRDLPPPPCVSRGVPGSEDLLARRGEGRGRRQRLLPGTQGGSPSYSAGCERCRTCWCRPRFLPSLPSSWICFWDAAGGRRAGCSGSFFPSFSRSPHSP